MSYDYNVLLTKTITELGENVDDASSADIDGCIQDAIMEYSKIHAQEKSIDFSGDGTAYSFSMPSDWMDGFSVIKQVEYPLGEQSPEIIKPYRFRAYKGTAGNVTFRLVEDIPSSTGTVRVTYLLPHTGSSSSFTIPDSDVAAVAALAASKVARQLAAQNARTQSNTMDADVVNYLSKVANWTTLADKLEDRYKSLMSVPKNTDVDASTMYGDWDSEYPWRGSFLTHPRSWQ